MQFRWDFGAFLDVLPTSLIGWLCIFVVTGILIGLVWVLNFVTNREKKSDKKGE